MCVCNAFTRRHCGKAEMNANDLDLRLLRSFLTVAHCGKVSTAAKQLHLSQPAVTAHLRRLEEIVGKPLISRSTRGVKLTTHGDALRIFSKEIQNTLSLIETSFQTENILSGELRFGASLTIASHVIPSFLASRLGRSVARPCRSPLTGCFRIVPQTIHFGQTKGGKFQSSLLRKLFHRTEPRSELPVRFVKELFGIELLFAGKIYHGKE